MMISMLVLASVKLTPYIGFNHTSPVFTFNINFSECAPGTYGQHCASSCHNCMGEDVCHHENGACPGDCDLGYTGDICRDGKCHLTL